MKFRNNYFNLQKHYNNISQVTDTLTEFLPAVLKRHSAMLRKSLTKFLLVARAIGILSGIFTVTLAGYLHVYAWQPVNQRTKTVTQTSLYGCGKTSILPPRGVHTFQVV